MAMSTMEPMLGTRMPARTRRALLRMSGLPSGEARGPGRHDPTGMSDGAGFKPPSSSSLSAIAAEGAGHTIEVLLKRVDGKKCEVGLLFGIAQDVDVDEFPKLGRG